MSTLVTSDNSLVKEHIAYSQSFNMVLFSVFGINTCRNFPPMLRKSRSYNVIFHNEIHVQDEFGQLGPQHTMVVDTGSSRVSSVDRSPAPWPMFPDTGIEMAAVLKSPATPGAVEVP